MEAVIILSARRKDGSMVLQNKKNIFLRNGDMILNGIISKKKLESVDGGIQKRQVGMHTKK